RKRPTRNSRWSAKRTQAGEAVYGAGESRRRKRTYRSSPRAPELSIAQILTWADAHFQRTGRWPAARSGPIADAPGETWPAPLAGWVIAGPAADQPWPPHPRNQKRPRAKLDAGQTRMGGRFVSERMSRRLTSLGTDHRWSTPYCGGPALSPFGKAEAEFTP